MKNHDVTVADQFCFTNIGKTKREIQMSDSNNWNND